MCEMGESNVPGIDVEGVRRVVGVYLDRYGSWPSSMTLVLKSKLIVPVRTA